MNKDLFNDFDSWSKDWGRIMIKNSKQLALTKKRIAEFSDAIEVLKSDEPKFSPLLAKAQLDALIFQRDELIKQADEYELLLAGDLAGNLSDVIYDIMIDRLYSEAGEIGADSFFFPLEKRIELDKIIGEFLDKNAQLPCFKVEDIVEFNVRMLEEGGELEVKISE